MSTQQPLNTSFAWGVLGNYSLSCRHLLILGVEGYCCYEQQSSSSPTRSAQHQCGGLWGLPGGVRGWSEEHMASWPHGVLLLRVAVGDSSWHWKGDLCETWTWCCVWWGLHHIRPKGVLVGLLKSCQSGRTIAGWLAACHSVSVLCWLRGNPAGIGTTCWTTNCDRGSTSVFRIRDKLNIPFRSRKGIINQPQIYCIPLMPEVS